MDDNKRLKELRKLKEIRDKSYYDKNELLVSDRIYDRDLEELRLLEKKLDIKSPVSEEVGRKIDTHHRITHKIPMLSLKKFYKVAKLNKWLNKLGLPMVIEPKLDGIAASARYVGGELLYLATRGDGKVGEDITRKAEVIAYLPLKLEGDFEVRGEIVIDMDSFEEIKDDLDLMSPRNAVAGAIALKSNKDTRARKPLFVAYDATDDTIRLDDKGFMTVSTMGLMYSNLEEYMLYDFRYALPLRYMGAASSVKPPTDGLVIKVKSLDDRKALGSNSREPLWASAYKFPDPPAESIITDIIAQVSKKGIVTPVAVFEPVVLGDSTVRKATLHNYGNVAKLMIGVGSKVEIVRAGGVIPKIVKVIEGKVDTPYTVDKCPSCQATLVKDGAYLKCPGKYMCSEQGIGLLGHFVSRKAMDIRHIGPQTIKVLYQLGKIRTPIDFYKDDIRDRLSEGMTIKQVDKVLESIDESRNRSMGKVLYAWSIEAVGRSVTATLDENYTRMRDILGTVDSLELGEVITKSLKDSLKSDTKLRELAKAIGVW